MCQMFTYACTHTHTQNIWVRYGAVGFLCAAARQLDTIDVECYVLPKVEPFLKHHIIQLKDQVGEDRSVHLLLLVQCAFQLVLEWEDLPVLIHMVNCR